MDGAIEAFRLNLSSSDVGTSGGCPEKGSKCFIYV